MKRTRSAFTLMTAAMVTSGISSHVLAVPTVTTFDNPSLTTTGGTGSFAYFNGATTSSVLTFGTASSFGLPAMVGGNASVASVPALAQNQGILLNTGNISANGGGAYLNQYTLGFDILVPNVNNNWFAFWNTNATNGNDSEAFINPSNGGIGIGGDYEGQIQSNTWHRVIFTIDTTDAVASTRMKKYIDGVLVGTTSIEGVDGRHAAYIQSQGVPTYLLTDNSGDTNAAFVSSLLFEDRVYSATEVAALGSAHAAGLNTPGVAATPPAPGAVSKFEWTFESGDLTTTTQIGGQATMSFFNASAQAATIFGNTATNPNVPDMPDGPANYMYHPQLGNGGASGYGINFLDGVDANGGGAYVNTYTMIADVYIPTLNWTPLFNTNAGHGNDADFYVSPGGALGIGGLGYSANGVVQADTWHRIAMVYDHGTDLVRYFVDGVQVFQGAVGGIDGRFSIFTDGNLGFDLLFDGEGDTSGNYTNEVYWGTFFFSNSALRPEEIAALGGASRLGILAAAQAIPEPATGLMLVAAAGAMTLRRRRASVGGTVPIA